MCSGLGTSFLLKGELCGECPEQIRVASAASGDRQVLGRRGGAVIGYFFERMKGELCGDCPEQVPVGSAASGDRQVLDRRGGAMIGYFFELMASHLLIFRDFRNGHSFVMCSGLGT
jgi:hypothetical protein